MPSNDRLPTLGSEFCAFKRERGNLAHQGVRSSQQIGVDCFQAHCPESQNFCKSGGETAKAAAVITLAETALTAICTW